MIGTYFEDSKLSEIEKSYAEKDWQNYRIPIHALKSTSLSIGAVPLSETAKGAGGRGKGEEPMNDGVRGKSFTLKNPISCGLIFIATTT